MSHWREREPAPPSSARSPSANWEMVGVLVAIALILGVLWLVVVAIATLFGPFEPPHFKGRAVYEIPVTSGALAMADVPALLPAVPV